MIDFACKQFQLRDVIKCGLALSKSDYNMIEFLLKNDEEQFTTQKLSEEMDLNLSTIQRSVKKLHEKKVLIRKQNNLSGGGYIFLYQIEDKRIIKQILIDIVKNWVDNVEEEIKRW